MEKVAMLASCITKKTMTMLCLPQESRWISMSASISLLQHLQHMQHLQHRALCGAASSRDGKIYELRPTSASSSYWPWPGVGSTYFIVAPSGKGSPGAPLIIISSWMCLPLILMIYLPLSLLAEDGFLPGSPAA